MGCGGMGMGDGRYLSPALQSSAILVVHVHLVISLLRIPFHVLIPSSEAMSPRGVSDGIWPQTSFSYASITGIVCHDF
jgi:hypothetical protein